MSVLYSIGSVKVLVPGCGLMPNIGVLLFVISFEAKRKVPSPPIVITRSAQSTHFASSILYSITNKLSINNICDFHRKLEHRPREIMSWIFYSEKKKPYGNGRFVNLQSNSELPMMLREDLVRVYTLETVLFINFLNVQRAWNLGAGSWLKLDGLKTLNTETCRTTAAADRPLDTAVIYTGTVYTRVVYTPADYTAADCTERDKATDRDVEEHYETLRTLTAGSPIGEVCLHGRREV
ncbi:hypothetical protein ALC60_11090 [Trachymyrmex zeteki]|uniref:Uncharacterized protein n=1 Tax=Mycetomoellerius zeteki TaxID=64791 RepID=A0A151WQE3_9HYME|nr:hypothetical protein ALC60_11090 [Trachymyrmex zeteki]